MAWLHLGRVLGMVALTGALLPVVASFAARGPAQMDLERVDSEKKRSP